MAIEQAIGGDNTLFVGEDKEFELEVIDQFNVPKDITTWEILFDVRKLDTSTTAIVSKTATIIGAYNADRTLNSQRAFVILSDDDMNLFKGFPAFTYRYSWKRMTTSNETVLAFGDFLPQKATAP
jgi:hypothetical protein